MADWTRILVMVETQQVPIYYFSRDDLAAVNLRATERTTYYPLKGAVFHWSVDVGQTPIENAVRSYEDPVHEALKVREHMPL